jgi:hypothetical protein
LPRVSARAKLFYQRRSGVVRSQNFDLMVLSNLRDSDLDKIINLADGANVVVLYEITSPSELLSLVAIASSMCSLFFPRETTKRSWLC